MPHEKDKQMHFIEAIELNCTSDISPRAINSWKYYHSHQFSVWSRVRLHAARLTFRRFATMGGVEFNARLHGRPRDEFLWPALIPPAAVEDIAPIVVAKCLVS